MMDLDRRTFMKGGLIAASAAAIGAVAGCSPAKKSEGGSQASSATSSSSEWYGEPLDVSTLKIVDTLEGDILVCGIGAGGIVATATAAEEGAHVIAIDRGASHGDIKSNIGIIGARDDASYGVNVDKTQILNEHTRYTNGWCNPRVTRVWVEESGPTFDWLCDSVAPYGATPFFETDTGGDYHGIWPVYPVEHGFNYEYSEEDYAAAKEKAGDSPDPAAMMQALPNISNYMMDKAQKDGAEIHYLTELVQLEKDENGRVTGAIAKNDDGYIRINAKKGVILATGGYEADPELLAKLNPQAAQVGGVSMVQMGCDGSGIKAGIWAGGVKDETPTLMTFSRSAIAPDKELGYPYQGMTCWMGDQPFLRVSTDGKRVCCESSPYDYPLFTGTYNGGKRLATIWDANYKDHIKAFHTIGCSRIEPSTSVALTGKSTGTGLGYEANDAMIAQAKEAGIIQEADTIEGLAKKLGIPEDEFKKTVEQYNEMCANGKDTEFGKESKDMLPLTTPPYCGSYFGGHVLCTLDGLKINENMQAVDKDNEPIEGLYAVGNCSGSMYAGSYPELFIGNANGRTITFARHAVKHALSR